jgi:hypothetical protein
MLSDTIPRSVGSRRVFRHLLTEPTIVSRVYLLRLARGSPSHANRFGAAMDLTGLYYEMAMADTPHMQGIMLMARPCASFWSAASGGRSIVLIRKRVELDAQPGRPRISSLRRSIWQRGSAMVDG